MMIQQDSECCKSITDIVTIYLCAHYSCYLRVVTAVECLVRVNVFVEREEVPHISDVTEQSKQLRRSSMFIAISTINYSAALLSTT